jgi:hypothetical protein
MESEMVEEFLIAKQKRREITTLEIENLLKLFIYNPCKITWKDVSTKESYEEVRLVVSIELKAKSIEMRNLYNQIDFVIELIGRGWFTDGRYQPVGPAWFEVDRQVLLIEFEKR